MKLVTLSAAEIPDLPALHAVLARRLDFPAWYGANLDALYDLLTERSEPTDVVLADPRALRFQLGKDYDRFLQVLRDAKEAGASINILVNS